MSSQQASFVECSTNKLLLEICENARKTFVSHLSDVDNRAIHQVSSDRCDNDIEVGTIVALIENPQPPDFLGLGIVVDVKDSVYR